MMYFFGAGYAANKAYDYLKKDKKRVSDLFGIIDTYKSGDWKEYKICKIEEVNKNEIIVITLKSPDRILQIAKMLINKGYTNVYYFNYLFPYNGEQYDFLSQSCKRITQIEELLIPHLEMHISDNCNLNCKGCTHFSPLFKTTNIDYDKTLNGLKDLNDKVDGIFRLYIMGGEPLLNDSLDKYLDGVSELLPYTEIWLVTNGLLVPQMNRKTMEIIRKNNIVVSITVYNPMLKKMPEIVTILEKNRISYDLRESEMPRKFCVPLTLSNDSKYSHICLSEGCINIRNDTVSKCPTAMYIWKLNESFDVQFPDDGVKKISDFRDGKDMLEFLNKEIPLCKHCIKNEIEWTRCGNEVRITDFAVSD